MSVGTNSPAIGRINGLLDANSFVELGSLVTSRSTDFNVNAADTPSDGVVIGHGLIDGNLVFVFSQDASVLGGSIGEMHAKKILSVYDMAMKMGAPVIGLLDSTGVRLQESVDALEAMGAILAKACDASGVVPQIMAVFGNCGGGLSVLTSLSDFVFMEKSAKLFVNSPDTIEGNSVDKCDTASGEFQFEAAGTVDFVGSDAEIFDQIRKLVTVIPGSNVEDGSFDECTDDLNRAAEGLADKRANVAAIAAELSDNHFFFETKAGYGKSMVTGFIKLNGITVGVVGNQASEQGNVLRADGCDKAAAFVKYCDAFEIPVLSLTNVNGYQACKCSERRLPKALAAMSCAFASASVAKINLITTNAGGSSYILMNSKSMGADLVYAFPDANVEIMNPSLAAQIINGDANEFAAKANGLNNAARRGYVDRIVNFEDARKYLIAGFEMLYTKKTMDSYKKHSTK
ncbi:MAG: carboxyl transferase [Lachnospiraceae bacterium]|nr:carboxyl transferase [Lachnospiraceae bacterium]